MRGNGDHQLGETDLGALLRQDYQNMTDAEKAAERRRRRDLEAEAERLDNGKARPQRTRTKPAPPSSVPSYESRCMAEITPEPIDWLWYRRMALGKLNIIAGNPGGGKSQVTLLMAASVSKGLNWPDGSPCPVGSVVVVSCEDDAADTVVPRLKALGADCSRIHTLDWVQRTDKNGNRSRHLFDMGQDIGALAAMVKDLGDVALIIIDPVSAYLGGLDSHKTSDVRGALAPLQELAGSTKAAVVLVSHLNKGSVDANAMARVSGSGAFVAACRSAWLVDTDPKDQTRQRRIMAPLKNNLGDDRTAFAFVIESVTLLNGLESSRVVFEPDGVEISASDLLREQPDSDQDRGALEEAMDFLREHLTDDDGTPCPQNAKMTKKAAEEAGISQATLRRARERLGVKVMKSKKTGYWVWALPEHVAQDSPSSKHEHLEQDEQHEAA